MCVLMSFWFGNKSAQNRNDQRLWQTNWKNAVGLGGVGGTGGVPRKSSKILPDSSQLMVQHAAPRVAADVWATASSADLRFRFASGVLDCRFAVLCFVSLGHCSSVQIDAGRSR